MEKTVVASLKLKIDEYIAGLAKAKAATTEFGREISGAGKSASSNITQVGHASLLMAAGVGAGLGLAAKAAISWESAWAGVQKTVQGSKSQMADLESGLRGLATTLPATHDEIAGVAAAAGQLGIQRNAIVEFTKTMVALSVTTNLSAEDAATGIAKIANVMQTPQGDIDRFGATLLALGNVGASTESEILDMASRLAGAGHLVGASVADVLGLANALTSMGIEAQLGGGSFSRTMLKIYSATKSGGDKLQGFADVAGVSADKFAAKFKKAPIEAVDDFVHGLGRIDAGGGNVIATLGSLGIHGTQDLQVLLKLKGSGDLLAQSLKIGSKAWQDNTALVDAAAKRYDTTASKLKVLGNQAVDVGIKFGGAMLPVLKDVTSGLSTVVTGFGQLPSGVRTATVGVAGFVTAGLGIVGLVGTVSPKIDKLKDSLSGMGSIGTGIAENIGLIGGALGVAGAAFLAYTYVVGQHAKMQAEAKAKTDAYTQAITKQGTVVGSSTDSMALTSIVAGNVGKALRSNGTDLDIVTAAMREQGAPARKMRSDLQDLQIILRKGEGPQGWLHEVLGGTPAMERFSKALDDGKLKGTALGGALSDLASSGNISTKTMDQLVARLREENAGLNTGAAEAKNKAAADAALSATSGVATTASSKLAAAYKSQATNAQNATDEIKGLNDAEHAALDPVFGMLDAIKENSDAQAALKKAQGDSTTSASDLAAAQVTVAKSALDMDVAATNLAGSIADGSVSLDVAKAQLQEWVTNGLISADTAKTMSAQFDTAATKANSLKGDTVMDLKVQDDATPTIDSLGVKLGKLGAMVINPVVKLTVESFIAKPVDEALAKAGSFVTGALNAAVGSSKKEGKSTGGWVGDGQAPGPGDTISLRAKPGEFVVTSAAAKAAGPALEQLNRTGKLGVPMQAASAYTGGGSSTSAPRAVASAIHVQPAPVQVVLGNGDHQFLTWLRGQIRIQGGDVQKALGA